MLPPVVQKKLFMTYEKISALILRFSSKIKIATFLILAFLLYAYLLIIMKTIYYKVKRLETLDELTMKTHKMIHELHLLDQEVGIQTEEYDEFYPDY